MQFTVTLELNDQELKALSKGILKKFARIFSRMLTFAILLLTLMGSIMNFLIWHWLSIRFLLLALEKSLKSSICWTTRSNCQNPSSNSVCSTGVCMMSIKPLQKSTGKITLRLYCISWEHLRQFSPQRIRIFLVIALRTMK